MLRSGSPRSGRRPTRPPASGPAASATPRTTSRRWLRLASRSAASTLSVARRVAAWTRSLNSAARSAGSGTASTVPSSAVATVRSSSTRQSVPMPRQSHWNAPTHAVHARRGSRPSSSPFCPSVSRIAWPMQSGTGRGEVRGEGQPPARWPCRRARAARQRQPGLRPRLRPASAEPGLPWNTMLAAPVPRTIPNQASSGSRRTPRRPPPTPAASCPGIRPSNPSSRAAGLPPAACRYGRRAVRPAGQRPAGLDEPVEPPLRRRGPACSAGEKLVVDTSAENAATSAALAGRDPHPGRHRRDVVVAASAHGEVGEVPRHVQGGVARRLRHQGGQHVGPGGAVSTDRRCRPGRSPAPR